MPIHMTTADGPDLGDQKEIQMAEIIKGTTVPYQIVGKRFSQRRIYLLVKCSLPEMSAIARRRVLDKSFDGKNAIGFIEWWDRGSIVNKPRQEFCIIVILRS